MVDCSCKYYLWTFWSTHWCYGGPTCLSSKAKASGQSCICRNSLGEVQGHTNLLQTAPCPLSSLCELPRLPLLKPISLCLIRCMKIKKKIATSENLLLANAFNKTGQVFCPDSVVAWKCPILSLLTKYLRRGFYPILKKSTKFCSWVQDELQLNIYMVKKNAVRWSVK